jgi:2-isopropylmalate synthase
MEPFEEVTFPLYDWGGLEPFPPPILLDTTLRDGVQSLLPRYPTLEEKLRLMELMIELGIGAFDVGFPISNARHLRHTQKLVEFAAAHNPNVRLTCLARSRRSDVAAIADVSQAAGVQMEALIFVASSPIRLLVEQWDLGEMVKWATEAIDFAIRQGLRVNFACEDATRSEPETLKVLHTAALEHGATRFTIPDTVGICNMVSTARIVTFLRREIIQGQPIGLDWHGHDDRGLAVANALAALAAGADCIHTTILGIGERSGNVSLESMLANLHPLCGDCYRLDLLPELVDYASTILGEPIPPRHPMVGKNAYTTAAGIHGAAILKARHLGRPELMANAYAGIDPRLTGHETEVRVGPLSGSANVEWVATRLGLPFSSELAARVLDWARELDRILTDDEIRDIAASTAAIQDPPPMDG